MIKQVQNSSYSSVFTPLQSNSVPSYALPKPIMQKLSPEQKEQEDKKTSHLGMIIASSGLTIGVGILLLSKIFSKKSGLNMNKNIQKLEEKVAKLKAGKSEGFVQNAYYHSLNGVRFVAQHSKAIFTIATLKDIVFKKAFMKVPVLRGIGNGITKFFEGVSTATSNFYYKRAHVKFERMFAKMREATENLPEHKAKQARELIDLTEQDYLHGFSESGRNLRWKTTAQNMSGLFDSVCERTISHPFEFVKDKDTYSKFLAEEQAAKAKIALNAEIDGFKGKISISNANKISQTKRLLSDINMYINLTDPRSRLLMAKLKAHLKAFQESAFIQNAHDFPNSEVAKDLSELGQYIKENKNYNPEVVGHISDSITKLSKKLNDRSQGKIQDIMDIFKGANLSEKEYAKLNKTVNRAVTSLDKATDMEGDKLFDKIRDLNLGSAIHDTIGFLGSIAAVGWYVGKADNKDERISAALKYGIPTVASVAITATCTFGLIASGPSLLIGLGSGLLINRIGKFIDNKRKQYETQKPTLKETVKKIEKDFST